VRAIAQQAEQIVSDGQLAKQAINPIKASIALLRDVTTLCMVALLVSLVVGGLAFVVYSGSPEWIVEWPLLALIILIVYIASVVIGGGLRGNIAAIALRAVGGVFVTGGLVGLAWGGFAVWQAVMDARNGTVVLCLLLVGALGVAMMRFGKVIGGPVREPIRLRFGWLPGILAVAFAAGSVIAIWLLWSWPAGQPHWQIYAWGLACVFLPFVVADYLWISNVMEHHYRKDLEGAVLPKMRKQGALAWLAVCAAVAIVAVPQTIDASVLSAAAWGGFIGFALSAFYALTLLTWLKGYSFKFVLLEVGWGTALASAVTIMAQRVATA